MRVAITGSRSITNHDWLAYHLDKLIDGLLKEADISEGSNTLTIISGGAKGVDTYAMEYAKMEGFDFILFKPYHLVDNREKYRPRFFFARNKQIVDNADHVIVFWDGVSSGSESVIEMAKAKKKNLTIVRWDPDEASKIAMGS
jgi:predicted Rossmann fold nucleotide-binding protein DprA/Smf involved in DNA uptake